MLYGPRRIKGEYVGLSVFAPIVVARQRLGKYVAGTKNCWRRIFLCGPCLIEGKYAISSYQNFLFNFYFTGAV